ncbi:MAG: ABC transporter permease subunit [Gemmataceae bacterium]|nr:ABC transporter permease subunit [Gemmataceae bacterium]
MTAGARPDLDLLHYRPWRGDFRGPLSAVWPIARTALGMLLRRKLFWVLYGSGLLIFLMFFFGTFLLDWAQTQLTNTPFELSAAERKVRSTDLIRMAQRTLRVLNGSQETFAYFFMYQGAMLMVVLALAGSVLVGNDFRFDSLPFYLAKPLSRWHYILGKCLAVGVVVNLLTTLPALVLYTQHALDDWDYLIDPDFFWRTNSGAGPAGLPLLLGVLGYGLLLTVFLSVTLVATASWVRRTVPMIMVWTTVFLFFRLLATILVDGLGYDERWRLIDLWNNLRLVGYTCLGIEQRRMVPFPQPAVHEAALVLGAVCLLSLIYLNLRTRAVEVVR